MSAALLGPSGRIPLETTPLMIGYTADNRLVVNDAQITSVTAIIAASGQNYTITAANSVYAVTLNGQQLVLHIAHELRPKDIIRIGEATFTYEESQPAPAPYTPIHPTYAEANPYGYDINNEAAIKATPEIARNVQTDSVQPVTPVAPTAPATGNQELPVQKGPITPIPDSSIQWPQYQITGNNLYATPPTFTPSQPFMQPVGETGKMPPGMGASAPSAQGQQSRSNLLKILLIALAVLIVLVAGGSGILAYQLTRPQPIIALSSQYMQNNVPIGAANTSLHVRGYQFSSNAPITFLLDNQPITTANVTSDGSGNFQADLPITTAWLVGLHKLTAKDSAGYLTTNGGEVRVVNPGEAGTPGPNGVPANDSSFTVSIKITDADGSFISVLTVKGNSSSDSATVCDAYNDSGQPIINYGSFPNGDAYKRTDTFSCQGTYKAGKLSYTETINSENWNISGGASCQAPTPITYAHIDGTFNNATTLSGTFSRTGYTANCTGGRTSSVTSNNEIGNWTGTIA